MSVTNLTATHPLSLSARFHRPSPRGVYVGTFNINKPADTFLSFEKWGKGLVYVNGHGIGRIWEIPFTTDIICAGTWLKKGENEVLVFDIIGPKEAVSFGSKTLNSTNFWSKTSHPQRTPDKNLILKAQNLWFHLL